MSAPVDRGLALPQLLQLRSMRPVQLLLGELVLHIVAAVVAPTSDHTAG